MPKTASASVLPKTWAMPQSSRAIVTFLASPCQRARSGLPARWNANDTTTTDSRHTMRFMTSPRRVAYRRTGAAGPTRPPGQRLVHEADPDLPISNLQPLEALAGGQSLRLD